MGLTFDRTGFPCDGQSGRSGYRFDQIADLLLIDVRGQIRLRHHAHQIVSVDDGKPTNLVIDHGPQSVVDTVVGAMVTGLPSPS